MNAPYLGTFDSGEWPPSTSLGVFYVNAQGWYVRAWEENFGPFTTRAEAEAQCWSMLHRGIELDLHHQALTSEQIEQLTGLAILATCFILGLWPEVILAIKGLFR